MALFKVLFSILLFSLTYSAPVEVPTGSTSEGHDPITTISSIDKDVEPSTKSDVQISTISTRAIPTLPPTEHSDIVVENNEGESLKPSDFVPTSVVSEEETIPPSSKFPLMRDSDPTSEPSIAEQHLPNENANERDSNAKADPPTTEVKQQDDVKSLLDDIGIDVSEPTNPPPQQPGDPFLNDRIPMSDPNPFDKDASSVPEEFDVPPQIADRDPPREPYEEGPLDQTPEPFNEEGANEGPRIYPQPPIGAETTNHEKVVYPPSDLPPEDDVANQPMSEIQNEPQDTDRLNSEPPQAPIGSELPQDEGKEPIEIAQPKDVVPPFETYDDPTIENEDDIRLPTPEQSDRPDEEDISPVPPFPINMDGPEEMVGDPVDPPISEEANPPAILVRDDLVPPVVSVIQMEQQAPAYINRENLPLSDDSVGGETPEEEVSNPDNTEPEVLSFGNRPEESGPMNIL